MQITIIGYGKMGHAVQQIAMDRGHHVLIAKTDQGQFSPETSDCVIDFTHASVAPEIIRSCINAGIPVVSGTTGWDSDLEAMRAYCREKNGAFLWAPNFSIGMHLVFQLNRTLAKLMDNRPEYNVEVLETHHTQKKDKPSGTAIALADQIVAEITRKKTWRLKDEQEVSTDTVAITAERLEDVKGIHRVTYTGPYDIISLRHKALSRDAFALGAVVAAEWLAGRHGAFTFEDVLK